MSGVTPAAGGTIVEHRTRWGVILIVWTAYGLLNASKQQISSALAGTSTPWSTALLLQMPLAYAWAIATPGILWLGRRFRLDRDRLVRSVVVHLLTCCALAFLLNLGYAVLAAQILPPLPSARPPLQRGVQLFLSWVVADGLLYWTILSVGYAVGHQRRLREREVAASQLETQLVQADLHVLKMQLQPHFLFNALHTIGSLIRTGDRDSAVRVVARLGDLLRRMLDGGTQQEVTLQEELDFVRSYLDIEQARLGGRLAVSIDVDPQLLEASVPHLMLQPLVENAIRHGIAPRRVGGRLVLAARRVNGRLEIVVRDDGPGIDDSPATVRHSGIGLANTRARLQHLYGDQHELAIANAETGGLEARIVIPFRLAPAEWSGER